MLPQRREDAAKALADLDWIYFVLPWRLCDFAVFLLSR
jgi:hypothetical protein